MNYYNICFNENGKKYIFSSNKEYKENMSVIVETEKGQQYGKIVGKVDYKNINLDLDEIKEIIREATKEDYNQYLDNLKDAHEALKYAKKIVDEEKLNMNLLDAYFTFDRNQLIFNFLSDERIDFRNMVKKIANKYKTRIELHQIGIRDKSKIVGGIGICGRELCCKKFLNEMETISINMAKNQNISLNPNKVNGLCGRLLCCFSYEDETYKSYRDELPKIGEYVDTPEGKGKVVSLDVLQKKYKVSIDGEEIEFDGTK